MARIKHIHTLGDADHAIAEWQSMLMAIDENLSDLDELDGMQKIQGTAFVQAVALTGATEARAKPAVNALIDVWAHRARLGNVVEEAARARKGFWVLNEGEVVNRIDGLLNGESIVLPGTSVPLALRSLVSSGKQENRLTPRALLDAMQKVFEEARDVALACQEAWDRLLPEIVAKIRAIDAIYAEALSLDTETAHECADLKAVAEDLRSRIECDPLGASSMASDLDPHIARLRRQVALVRDAQGTAQRSLDWATQLLADLQQTNAEILETYTQCQREVSVDVEIKPPLERGKIEGLIPWLATLRTTMEEGRLKAAMIGLDRWIGAAQEYAQEAHHAIGVNQGLLSRKEDLAGLLRARKAQADDLAQQGLYVPSDAESAYQRAKALLAIQPCRLALIGGLVHTYDTAVGQLARSARKP